MSTRTLILVLLALESISAIAGGAMLMLDPSGGRIGLPLAFLKGTPFAHYFIPGLFLFLCNGVLGLITVVFTWKNAPIHPQLLFLQGSVLLGWLGIQLWLNPAFFLPHLHLPLFLISFLCIGYGSQRVFFGEKSK